MDKLSELRELAKRCADIRVSVDANAAYTNFITTIETADIVGIADYIDGLQARVKELEQEQSEHDEQIARMEEKFNLAKRALDSKTVRCNKAETELSRRRAQEPVALQNFRAAMEGIGHIQRTIEETFGGLHGTHCEPDVLLDCKRICDAICEAYREPRPAAVVVPPEMIVKLDGLIKWIEQLPIPTNSATKWLIEMHAFREQFIALSGQPQKFVVKLAKGRLMQIAYETDPVNADMCLCISRDGAIKAIRVAGGEVE